MTEKLSTGQLIYAYANGYFPMADDEEGGEIFWHRPEKRGVIPLNEFHVSKNMRRLWRSHSYDLRINTAFEEVVRACSERSTTWINEEIVGAYTELSEMGYAASFEVWKKGKLVGGLYGVSMGRAFFGESMFSRETNTSKLALIFLVEYLNKNDFMLLDTQYLNDHLKQFGAREISDEKYMALLDKALGK
ncbi:MAG: leucyl/phenylalanyl-tRNA--protein transferase [Bacteroidia bacterium]|nr:leucyl/phenylalanyl-tRNA--protein transferase [Bacteroidia bacterium]